MTFQKTYRIGTKPKFITRMAENFRSVGLSVRTDRVFPDVLLVEVTDTNEEQIVLFEGLREFSAEALLTVQLVSLD